VRLGRIEMHVAQDILSLLDEQREKHLFSTPSLMNRYRIRIADDILHRFGEIEVVSAACIALVSLHQTSPLVVAHGPCATVGQKIDVHIFPF